MDGLIQIIEGEHEAAETVEPAQREGAITGAGHRDQSGIDLAELDLGAVAPFTDGTTRLVDVTEPIYRLKHFRALRQRQRFAKVAVGDWGWSVTWGGDLDLSNDRLVSLAEAQQEAEMTPGYLRAWLRRRGMTQAAFAERLGISPRMVAYYSTGEQPITRLVALAMKGFERRESSVTRSRTAAGRAKRRG